MDDRRARYIGKPGNVVNDELGKLQPGMVLDDPGGKLAARGDFEAVEAVKQAPEASEEVTYGTD